jgi:hypothetical protein
MIKRNKITRLSALLLIVLGIQLIYHSTVIAGGISIDAGLTPAENRWMVRSQMRILQRDNNPMNPSMEMKAYMFPLMVAYGLRSDATIMIRQAFMRREMTMMGNSNINSGLGDLFVLGKYRLIRINTPTYTLGIAPTLGLEFPTGEEQFTSNSFDLRSGMFLSGRMHSLRLDLNLSYVWNGMALTNDTNIDPGNEFAVEAAVSRQFGIGDNANFAIAPVLESSFQKLFADNDNGTTISNTGESIFLVAPGLKLTRGSFILEGLVQFPVSQSQEGSQTERSTTFILGIRLMN